MRFLSRKLDSGDKERSGVRSSSSALETHKHGLYRWFRRFAPLIATTMAIILLAGSLLIGWVVQNSMRELTRKSLRSILSANVTALDMWLHETRLDVSRLAEGKAIHTAAHELLRADAENADQELSQLKQHPAYQTLMRDLQVDSYLGWALLDAGGRVVASDHDNLVGQRLPIYDDARRQLDQIQTTVCRPFKSPVPLSETGPLSRADGSVMCAMAPLTTGARTVGSLALLIDPLGRFTELLSVARTGRTGETYAFDRAGMLISQSRFEHHLRAAGLLDTDPLVSSPLNVAVRDPGVNLVMGNTTSMPRDLQPLTRMADQATRGATGDDVIGYNDYRGVPVVGAWRWLPEYGIGVTTEMDVAEAYQPLRLLQNSYLGLLGLIACSGIGLLLLASVFRRINDRFQLANREARRLGQYQLGEVIGRGGMGVVYRGAHKLLRRDVAIKVLEGENVTQQSVSRFEREVQNMARLRHPNTIDIYDYGTTEDGTFFYVMEFVDGITLQELVDEYGPQPPGRTIHLMLQICGSLSEAHQLGMIHRDIKPSNILVTAQAGLYDMIKLLDFGLVKEVDRETVELTRTDGITGTPMYMSPESVRDAATADHRSDLYSVGAVGYTLLSGLPTFDSDASLEVCWKQLNEDPIRPSDRIGRPLPDDLQNLLMSCLRKDPQDRPMSIDDLQDALRHCADAAAWSTADAVEWWESEFKGVAAADDTAFFDGSATGDPDNAHTDGTVIGNQELGSTPR